MQATGLFRIGNDPTIRYTGNGTPVLELSLATNYYDPKTKTYPTQWVKATLFGKRAESVMPYVNKGAQCVCTVDELHIEEWTAKDGKQGISLVGVISKIDPVLTGEKGQSAAKPAAQAAQQTPPPADFDDDIPF